MRGGVTGTFMWSIQWYTCLCTTIPRGVEQMLRSQVDMHTYTDAYKHSNQSVRPEHGWLRHINGTTQEHTFMQLWKGSAADVGIQVHMHTSSDACTHSNQGVGPEEEWLGHTQGTTGVHMSAHNYAKGGTCGKSGEHAYMYWCMYTF